MTAWTGEEIERYWTDQGYGPNGEDPRGPVMPRPAPGDLVTWTCPNGTKTWVPSLRPEPEDLSQPYGVAYDVEHVAVLAALPRDGGRWLYLFVCYGHCGMGWAWCSDDDADVRVLVRS